MKIKLFSKGKLYPVYSEWHTSEIGAYGELCAAKELAKKQYRIVIRNYTAPLHRGNNGRTITGEIDIIAYDQDGTLCFIEVKTRTNVDFATPQSAVDLRKQRKIVKTSKVYRRIFQLDSEPYRYDVVSVILKNGVAPQIEIFKNYFSEQNFCRSNWWKRY